jgi:ech hydrogenase subunit E
MEMPESVRLIEEALRKRPQGPTRAETGFPVVAPGEATSRTEAPRGELFYYLASGGTDMPTRVKIRRPSF